jgi:sulfide:quinone oxidoreductase
MKKRILVLGAGFGGLELSTMDEPSVALRADKEQFGSSRRARWFGL